MAAGDWVKPDKVRSEQTFSGWFPTRPPWRRQQTSVLVRPDQRGDADHDQGDSQRLTRRGRLLEGEGRDRLREQHLDQRERAHAGSGGEREGQEPELRGESAKEPGQK